MAGTGPTHFRIPRHIPPPAPLARLTTGGGGGVFYQFLESLSGSTDSGRDGRKGSVSISLFDVL